MAKKAAAMKVGGCTEDNIEQRGLQIDDLQFQKVLGYVQKGDTDEGATRSRPVVVYMVHVPRATLCSQPYSCWVSTVVLLYFRSSFVQM
jgi:hypothetical protein